MVRRRESRSTKPEDYIIYPAPIITVTKNRFTKHYFIGDKRIASKLGTGKFSNVYGISSNNVTAGQKDYAARMLQIEKQREDYYRKLGTPPGVPTMKGATADPDNTGYGYNTIIGELGDHSVPEGWVQRPKFNDKGDVPGPPIQWQKPEDPDNAQPGYGYVPTDTTNIEEIFFYHSDHLGSTSYITDAKANITQFDAYLPYGELLVDEHSSSEDMPYKFNGKELDQETGLYYYGARYMNPVTSLWYGVDMLKEKYPNISGYSYTRGNPIRFIDPDGKIVKPGSQEALTVIRNTLTTEDMNFVQLDRNGYIDRKLINSHKSESKNFNNLTALVNSDILIEVSLVDGNVSYRDNEGRLQTEQITYTEPDPDFADPKAEYTSGLSTGEGGKFGLTLLPGKGESGVNSPDDNIRIYIQSRLSPEGKAETYSHEGNGHALLYVETKDRRISGHQIQGDKEGNIRLRNKILESRQETIRNMKSRENEK